MPSILKGTLEGASSMFFESQDAIEAIFVTQSLTDVTVKRLY